MGRKLKKGLDYAPWDVDVFLGDREIDKLMEAQGCTGFVIYFYLCQMAAKFEGYFLKWSYDDAATTAKRVGGGAGSEAVKQTVALCLQMGLFNKRLFDRYGILTSRRIQENYAEAKARQNGTTVISEYWLLEKNYSPGGSGKCALSFVSCDINGDSCGNNPDSCGKNSAESRGEKRRVEESRREESRAEAERGAAASPAPATPPALFASASPMDSAYDYFRNYINPSAPNRDFEELAEFVRFFNEHGGEGNAVAIYACQIAQSKRAFKWPFIRTVLNGWKCAGVYTLAQCEAHERDWQERRKTGNAKGNPTPGTPHYARGTKLNPDGTWDYDPGDTSGSL